jgi:hypothetical protein
MAMNLVGVVPMNSMLLDFRLRLQPFSPDAVSSLDFQPGPDYLLRPQRVGQGLGLIEVGGYSMETGNRPSRHDLGGV